MQVPILEDSLAEPTEQFHANLTLVENNGISVMVDPAVATVNILDDDSELGIDNFTISKSIWWGNNCYVTSYPEYFSGVLLHCTPYLLGQV